MGGSFSGMPVSESMEAFSHSLRDAMDPDGGLKKDCLDPSVDPVNGFFDCRWEFPKIEVTNSNNIEPMVRKHFVAYYLKYGVDQLSGSSELAPLNPFPDSKLRSFGMSLDSWVGNVPFFDVPTGSKHYAYDELIRSKHYALSADGVVLGSRASKGLEFPEIEGNSFTASAINKGKKVWTQHLDEMKYLMFVSQANPQSGSYELRRLSPSSDSAAVAGGGGGGGGGDGGSGGSATPTGHPGGAGHPGGVRGGGQSSLSVAVSGGDDSGGDGNHPNSNQGITLNGSLDVLSEFLYALFTLLHQLRALWRAFTGRGATHPLAITNLRNAFSEFFTATANLYSYASALRANNSGVFLALLLVLTFLHTVLYFLFMHYFGHFIE